MTPSERIVQQMRANRTHWLDLGDGKSVGVLRPAESEQTDFLQATPTGAALVAELRHVQKFVAGWKGFVEADLVGASGATDLAVDFTPELWAEVCADRNDYTRAVAQKLIELIVAHRDARDADAKN